MKTWEVIIPPASGGSLQTLIIEAATSMMALSDGLQQISDPAQLSSLMCKILPHGALEVVDNRSGRTITIRELNPADVQTAAANAPQAPAEAQPPAQVPPPDPRAPVEKSSETAVGLPTMGSQGQATTAAVGQAQEPAATGGQDPRESPAPTGTYKRRKTREMVSTASGIANAVPTPPPVDQPAAQPSAAQPSVASPPAAQPSVASPPVASPPVASPPVASPPMAAPPPTAQVPVVDPVRSSGEVMGADVLPDKPLDEPAIIIDDHLQAEIEQLENLRRAREAAMTPPAMRPLPHKVFKVLAEAAEAPRFETVRRRYVSVWPNPPQEALEEVLQIQIAQIRSELESTTGAKRVLVAAFDHAFEKIPLRPPLGMCTWNTSGSEDPDAAFVYGEQAATLWSPVRPATGTDKSPVMVPALDAYVPTEDVKTALMTSVDAEGRPVTSADMGAPLPEPPAGSPAPGAAAGGYPAAPSPVQYPSELQGRVYDMAQPAPPPDPPTGTLDPFYPPAHDGQPSTPNGSGGPAATAPAPPSGAEPTDLMSQAFQRFQPLFYVTDRQLAFAFAIDTALGLVPSAAGVLLLYDYQARDLYSTVIRAPGGAQIPGYRAAVGESVAGFCATQGLPLALTQGDQDARFSTVLGAQCGLQVHNLVGVPIQYQGRLYGVLELANRQAEGAYSTEEINALAYIGRQLAERLSTTLSTQMPAIPDPFAPPV